MKVAGFTYDSVVDGEGLRNVVFVQGCTHGCEGCHNPSTWDKTGGITMTVDSVYRHLRTNNRPVTISGGEPFQQGDDLSTLCITLKDLGTPNIWVYTGYTLEYLRALGWLTTIEPYIDVIVDGKYEKNRPPAQFRGSDNQRIWRKVDGVWTITTTLDV